MMVSAGLTAEREQRLRMYGSLEDATAVPARRVNELRIYVPGRGIWVDKARTQSIDSAGITVGILHTGRHYPDDVAEDGIVYHYPTTDVPGKDKMEIEATKACRRTGMPLFVVLPSDLGYSMRSVRLGWVND